MKIAIGSDEANELTTALMVQLEKLGHQVMPFGPLAPNDPNTDWPLVASRVAEAVARGEANEGIVCCWTGTGACIAANKVPGIRAALVHDAETAREILNAWFATSPLEGEAQSEWNLAQIERIRQLEEKYRITKDKDE